MRKFYMKQAAKLGLVGTAAVAYVQNAMAAVDIAGVTSGIAAAQASAESVGGLVVAAVAAIVVIGLIIGIVRKL